MQELFANNAESTIADVGGITSTATTITLASGEGARFPAAVTGTSQFRAALVDASTNAVLEYVTVTNRSTDTLTVTRESEDATRFPKAARAQGVKVVDVITAAVLSLIGVPPGGTAGQVLGKSTSADYAQAWVSLGTGIFGDGSDGVINFDGSTTVLGLAPSSGVYSLTRNIYLADGSQVSGTAQIKTNGWAVFCIGTFTIGASAKVQWDGTAATTSDMATSGYVKGGDGGGSSGGSGRSAVAIIGAAGGASGSSNGGGAIGNGNSGGSVTTVPLAFPRNLVAALMGGDGVNRYTGGTGGGGGNAAASSTGGSGGQGGGVVVVSVQKLVNNGAISAVGGDGGAASGTGTGAGGGGGGGGGAVILIHGTSSTVGTISRNGGAGGSPQGAGNFGAAGSTGKLYEMTA